MLIYSSKQMVLIYADISLLRQIDTYFIHTYTYVVYIWKFFRGGGNHFIVKRCVIMLQNESFEFQINK